MKKITYLVLIFVAVSLLVGASFAGASPEAGMSAADPVPSQDDPFPSDPFPGEWPEEPGAMPPLINGKKVDRPLEFIEIPSDAAPQSVTTATINVWYGASQNFGGRGNPQQWVNILGNASATTGITSLTYSLRGGPEMPLTLGDKNKRLVYIGDFNIELDKGDLISGPNSVLIKLVEGNGIVTTKNVTVNYTPGVVWNESYDAKWDNTLGVQASAQVVDGNWTINAQDNLVLKDPIYQHIGYDRLVAIGDMGNAAGKVWTDYEVTVPITVRALDPTASASGVGVMTRWQGHTQDLADPDQPRLRWDRIGALGWYQWKQSSGEEGLSVIGYKWWGGTSSAKVWEFNKPYMLKMSVQSAADITGNPSDARLYYRLKLWKQGTAEPFDWDVEGFTPSAKTVSPSGSVVLIAHNIDAEFGDVKIRPLDEMSFNLKTKVTGDGDVSVNGNPPTVTEFTFPYGGKATLKAAPDPLIENNILDDWTLSDGTTVPGAISTLNKVMTSNLEVTANFKVAKSGTLNVETDGNGSVQKDPDKETYAGGEIVTVTAKPKSGYAFSEWSGDLTGNSNPAAIRIDGNKTVKASFVAVTNASPKSDDFSQCGLDTNVWTFVNPSNAGSYNMTGTAIQLEVPAGVAHTMWGDNRDAPRIMQDTMNHDFTVDIKFETIPSEKYQIEGLLVEQDEENWLRFDFFRGESKLIMFAGGTIGGKTKNFQSTTVTVGADDTEIYMRVRRVGDSWTQSYMLASTSWISADPVNQTLEVASTGVFAGNQPPETGIPAPAFMSQADYFMNTSFPIDPEDGATGSILTVDTTGQGVVQQSPQPNAQNRYNCGQEVTLTAVPSAGNDWKFGGWSGDLSGLQNPAKIVMDRNHYVTANFTQGAVGIFSYMPSVMRP